MSFTDQKPFILDTKFFEGITERNQKFCCNICGEDFKVGDTVRWIYAGSIGMVNFWTCTKCDGEDILERGKASIQEAIKQARKWDIYGPDWEKERY